MDILRGEHITHSNYTIITGIWDDESCFEDDKKIMGFQQGSYIDYSFFGDPKYSKEAGFIISDIDSKNKYSTHYYNCTGIVAIGESKTGEKIGFLTHQNPSYYNKNKENFTTELGNTLETLSDSCQTGTIDIVILGGNLRTADISEYYDGIQIIDEVVFTKVGFHPIIISGPSLPSKTTIPYKHIYVDTLMRRVLFFKGYNKMSNDRNCTADKLIEILNRNGK